MISAWWSTCPRGRIQLSSRRVLLAALDEMLEAFGFEAAQGQAVVIASWLGIFWTRLKAAATSQPVQEQLALILEAFKEWGVNRPKATNIRNLADAADKQASAIAKLATVLDGADEGVLSVEGVFMAKVTDASGRTTIIGRQLTADESRQLRIAVDSKLALAAAAAGGSDLMSGRLEIAETEDENDIDKVVRRLAAASPDEDVVAALPAGLGRSMVAR